MPAKYLFFLLSLFLFLNQNLNAQRQIRNIDKNWKFIQQDVTGAEQSGFKDKRWRTLDIPHDWSIEHAFSEDIEYGHRIGYLPTGIGWYRKTIDISGSDLNKEIQIEFDGVYMNSDVWINGHHLGHYPNGYVSFHYDLTPHLIKGKNRLAVRVDNSKQPNSRWYSGSGIYRHVRLVLTDPLHIKKNGVFIITPVVDEESAEVAVSTEIINKYPGKSQGTLLTVISRKSGKEISRTETEFIADENEGIEIQQKLNVPDPELWSVESPGLYSAKSCIKKDGRVIDEISTTFGIREIEYDAWKGFLLNGKQVKMNGVNIHHAGGCVGAAVPEAVWIRRLKVLKEMGCNAIRTAHNPVAPEFLDICDSLGFLVMNEVFDEWKESKGNAGNVVTYGYHVYFDEWAENDLIETIRRDRNHPSVVLWSVGNEVPDQVNPDGHETLKMLSDICHKEDPTRPVTQGCDRIGAHTGPATLEFLNGLDIVGYNYVDRWGERKELYFSVDKLNHPDWKMIGTESSSVRGVRGNYSLGNDPHRVNPDYLNTMINPSEQSKFVATRDYVIGDFMWTGIDYLGEAHWPNINSVAGAIDRCGFPKDGFYFYQSVWTEEPMIHLFPHWNWEGREGQFIPVIAYTNCDVVELYLNGKLIGQKRKEFPRNGMVERYGNYDPPLVHPTTSDLHLLWDVPYEPGVLKAVGKIQGEVVFTKELKTTGSPAKLRLSADKKIVSPESWDVSHIKVEVLDDAGNVVPYADNLIEFNLEGGGKIIGVDNGDPKDHASFSDNKRKAFHGLVLAIVKANASKGTIRISAESPGLTGDLVEVEIE